MLDIGAPELIIILVIVILLFGVGRISAIAGELGKGVREFREGLSGTGEETTEVKLPDSEALTVKK
jgi:sec-independent protein translocase protein TatA